MAKLSFNRVLVLSPHTDDGEFGCGATISKLLSDVFNSCQEEFEESVIFDFKS